jgi:hypothetical protein
MIDIVPVSEILQEQFTPCSLHPEYKGDAIPISGCKYCWRYLFGKLAEKRIQETEGY